VIPTPRATPPISPAEFHKRIQAFLEETRVMTLATYVDGTPWACTLAFAYDGERPRAGMLKRSHRIREWLCPSTNIKNATT
jgi:hypothetical protein